MDQFALLFSAALTTSCASTPVYIADQIPDAIPQRSLITTAEILVLARCLRTGARHRFNAVISPNKGNQAPPWLSCGSSCPKSPSQRDDLVVAGRIPMPRLWG